MLILDKKSSFFYFYGPIGIIFFCNILMFVHTAVIIFRQMKDRLNCENAESKINSKQDIWRYVKQYVNKTNLIYYKI